MERERNVQNAAGTAALESTKKERVYFIDLLRIIACFGVIVNHTDPFLFLERAPTLTWYASVFYFFASKIAVPVFLMISGYTMLDKQDTHRKALSRFLRYGLTLVIFSGVSHLAFTVIGGGNIMGPGDFLKAVINTELSRAYWYMYLYLGIILMMPFLQKMVSAFQKSDFHVYFFWSGLFYAVWPMVAHYIPDLQLNDDFSLPLFNSYLCMLLLGYYIKKYAKPTPKWRLPCVVGFVLMCGLNTVLTYWEFYRCAAEEYLFFDDRTFLPILIESVCVFCFVSTIKLKERLQKIVIWLGGLTFGIYLVSDLAVSELKFIYTDLCSYHIHELPAMLVYEIAVFVVCAAAAWVLKKIPGLRKLL